MTEISWTHVEKLGLEEFDIHMTYQREEGQQQKSNPPI